jgi:hypothetical protein
MGRTSRDSLRPLRRRLESAWSEAGARGRPQPRCGDEGSTAGLAPHALLFAKRSSVRKRTLTHIQQENACRSHQWCAGSWSWCACGRRPRAPDRARIRDAPGCRNIPCRDRSAGGRLHLMGVVERHNAIVEEVGGGDRRLPIIELGEGDLGVGVDEGLLVDASCPTSDDLRHVAGFQKGGSGSSEIEIMRRAVGAASDGLRLSGV